MDVFINYIFCINNSVTYIWSTELQFKTNTTTITLIIRDHSSLYLLTYLCWNMFDLLKFLKMDGFLSLSFLKVLNTLIVLLWFIICGFRWNLNICTHLRMNVWYYFWRKKLDLTHMLGCAGGIFCNSKLFSNKNMQYKTWTIRCNPYFKNE